MAGDPLANLLTLLLNGLRKRFPPRIGGGRLAKRFFHVDNPRRGTRRGHADRQFASRKPYCSYRSRGARRQKPAGGLCRLGRTCWKFCLGYTTPLTTFSGTPPVNRTATCRLTRSRRFCSDSSE